MSIDPSRLTEYALFRAFWQFPDVEVHAGLAHMGLDEIDDAGVQKIVELATNHDVSTLLPAAQMKTTGQLNQAHLILMTSVVMLAQDYHCLWG